MNVFRNMLYMARRFKTATVLNFVGLTVAFAACYLFLTQVTYNHSFNKGLTDHERLYRVEVPTNFFKSGWQSLISRLEAETIEKLPQIESMALVQGWSNNLFMKGETEFFFNSYSVTNNALKTLAPRLVDGVLTWTDDDQQGIIIPASIAERYFGSRQVAGHCMWNGKDSIVVRGVFEDFPENSLAGNGVYENMKDDNKDNQGNHNYNCFVRLHHQADTTGIGEAFNQALKQRLYQLCVEHDALDEWERGGSQLSIPGRLRPVSETWFSGVDVMEDKGNPVVDLILQLACLLVIVIAAINFLNFTLAESPMRIKSINTRRVLGSSLSALRFGLVAETVAISLAAFLLAVGVIYLISVWPFIKELTVGSIALSSHPLLLLTLAFVAVIVGIVAGTYPAFYVTSFQPALVLKGSFGLSPKGRQLRTGLLCLQFVITSIMVIYISILNLQSHYIFHSDYGFAKDELLLANIHEIYDKRDALRSELMQMTGVKDAGLSLFPIASQDQYMGWGRSDDNHHVNFTALPVDWHYLQAMGIEIVEGRDFNEHDSDCYIINEAARSQWSWVEMDKPLLDNDLTVVGVCRNVRFASTRMDNNSPMAFVLMGEKFKDWGGRLHWMNVRVAAGADKKELCLKIKDLCMKFGAKHEPTVIRLDQKLEDTYKEEFRFIRQVLVFSVICMIITLIGVFCMTMFETEYRRKEIGIRKVMGSTAGEILSMLCRRYVWLLIGSFVVAAPLAWYIGNQWLQSFAERTPIYWWLFPVALLAVATVTLVTIIIQSWRAATENPVNSIKNE